MINHRHSAHTVTWPNGGAICLKFVYITHERSYYYLLQNTSRNILVLPTGYCRVLKTFCKNVSKTKNNNINSWVESYTKPHCLVIISLHSPILGPIHWTPSESLAPAYRCTTIQWFLFHINYFVTFVLQRSAPDITVHRVLSQVIGYLHVSKQKTLPWTPLLL